MSDNFEPQPTELDTITAMRFHEKISRVAAAKRLNQSAIAVLTGIPQTSLSRWMSGKAVPKLGEAFALARALGVSLDYLADDSLDDPPPPAAGPDLTPDEVWILETARALGPDKAKARLLLRIRGIDPTQAPE
jgi:transcriptional regulator with XRE-family HTH domain